MVSYILKEIKQLKITKIFFALNVFSIDYLNLILNDNEKIYLEKNDIIEYISEI